MAWEKIAPVGRLQTYLFTFLWVRWSGMLLPEKCWLILIPQKADFSSRGEVEEEEAMLVLPLPETEPLGALKRVNREKRKPSYWN
jgi:hypothetical protein